jgi:hypothetical protein
MVLFGYTLIGFILKRGNFLPSNTATVISKLVNFVLMPATIINTFMDKCTVENLTAKWSLLLYSSLILLGCILLGIFAGRFFSKDYYTEKIYRYSLTVGNFAFLGIAFVEGLAPEILFDYLLFILPMNLYTFSLGVAWLIPEDSTKGKFTLKSFFNPICISLGIGIILGLTQAMSYIPAQLSFLTTIIQGTAKTMAPMAMILTGFVIGSYPLIPQLKNYKVYICGITRLVAIPLVIVGILKLINTPAEIVRVALCANAMPMGLNTVIIPSAYGKDPRLGGSLALVSQLMALFTIPILFSLFF